VEAHVAEWIQAKESAEAIALLETPDAAISLVYSMKDLFADPHVAARQMLTDVDGMTMQNVVAKLNRTPGTIRGRAPTLGEHTDDVLSQLHDSPGHVRPDRQAGSGHGRG
jgi:formyl-CoA transferase